MRSAGLALLIVLLVASDARACSCVGAANGFPRAEGAFSGEIVGKHEINRSLAYVFSVEKVYKGSYPRTVTLGSTLEEASCGMDRPVGFRTGVVIFGEEQHVGICNLISEEELDELATPSAPAGPPPAAAEASLLGALLGTCWSVLA